MSQAIDLALAHLAAEDVGDVAATMATFTDACYYRIPALGIALEGKDAIAAYYAAQFASFPVFVNAVEQCYEAPGHVFVTLRLERLHGGQWGPYPPTGKRLYTSALAHFPIAPDGLLAAEIVYVNPAETFHQLGLLPSADLRVVADELARLRARVAELEARLQRGNA